MSANYTAADYAGALTALLPRGRVWPATPDSTQGKLLQALGLGLERIDSDAVALLGDANPATTADLLPEWEETLGLPDPCLGPGPTAQQRRDQVAARFGAGGGQSAAYLINFAASLGFEIEISTFTPFRTGLSRVGQPLRGEAWAHAFLVTIVSGAVSADHAAFRVGQNRTGDPLASTSTAAAALECELRAIAPAHTVPLFSF